MKRTKKKKSIIKLEDSGSGNGLEISRNTHDRQRRAAIKALPLGKKVEKERSKKGFKWVTKGKTTKQIHRKKLKAHLADGWVKVSRK